MSHHLYQTDALILSGTEYREADRFVRVFTRELGMIAATATGVRHEKSKLRYSLQELSLVSLSTVRGASLWRITNAAPQENFFQEFRSERPRLSAAARLSHLLIRLVPGESPQPELFDLFLEALQSLRTEKTAIEDIPALEQLAVLRMLRFLGHLPDVPVLRELSESTDWHKEKLTAVQAIRRDALFHINTALRETQL